jgi:hypothetical protein
MKRFGIRGLIAAGLFLSCVTARAQDTSPKEQIKVVAPRPDGPQLKVQIVFSEYEGEKKTKSLPYTLLVIVGGDTNSSKLRMGDRVPIATSNGGKSVEFQYVDVGTSIDCRAFTAAEGRYRLTMNLDRSWVQSDVPIAATADGSSGVVQVHQPSIRQFRTDTSTILRDGQTVETNFATDPVSGKVIKVEISINVIK